jgi:putative ABC transport system permease protein
MGMRQLRTLDRKALRDLWQLRGPVVAIIVVVVGGVASFVAMRSMVPHLASAQTSYYRTSRFADLWVTVTRAPAAIAREMASIPGVTSVETRVSGDVVLDVPGLAEPASGRVIGMPLQRTPSLNRLSIQRGRMLSPGREDDVVISEGFATANRLSPGDSLGAVMHGRWRRLHIVGVALSPEFVLELRGADLFPDNRRYGILWISEDAAAAAFGMQGAWNEAAIGLATGTAEREVIARLDALLMRYGSLGAYGRSLQLSHRYLTDEIAQARAFAAAAPLIFLGVAAFLLNIVLSRIVASQREQVGMLKAFGVSTWDLSRHYALVALIPVLAGALLGCGVGVWLAQRLAELYAQSYRIPHAPFQPTASVMLTAVGISVAAALVGALNAVRRVQRLPAAEAMRPEAPLRYRAGIAERLRLGRWLSPVGRMTLRSMERRPWRAVLSMVGMALGVAVMILGLFLFDSIDAVRDVYFDKGQREDIAVAFVGPRGPEAMRELAQLRGVSAVEPTRILPVRLRHEQRARQVAIVGVNAKATLRRVVDADGEVVPLPADGLLLSRTLAELLGTRVGDTVQVDVLTGTRPSRFLHVGALLDDLVGANAYLPEDALHSLVREAGESGDAAQGAVLAVAPEWRDAVYARLKHAPGVASIGARAAVRANFDQMIDDTFNVTLLTVLVFACALSLGVVYNTARIALSEQSRELASLRVLGFTRGEVARMLFGEQIVLGLAAIPVGFAIGTAFSWMLVSGVSTELFRLPLVISPRTLLSAALMMSAAGLGSSVLVRRKLDQLDLVAVLKTRE